ncbi:MAG: lytic transglycosylase, partial [Comamonadaceae bacterium]
MIQILRVSGLIGVLWLAGCAAVPPPAADTAPAAPAPAPVAVQAPPPAPAFIPSGPLQPITAAEAAARGVAQLQPPADLWDRIRRGFRMPNLEGDLVRQQEQWYTSRPDYIQRMTERSRKYLFHIVEELERRNMPTELALLPFIESAFNP